MNPAVIEGWTAAPGAPKDWNPETHGRCSALPIRVEADNGLMWMRSAWSPTDGEVIAQMAGANIELGIGGGAHPVVQLGIGPLPADAKGDRIGFVVTRETDDDGAVWCRVLGLIGPHRFPTGMEIRRPGHVEQSLEFSDAAARLISAIEAHAKDQGWIK